MMRGQASSETVIIVGFVLALLLPLLLILLGNANSEGEKLGISQAGVSAQKIADSAFEVYSQGSGAKKRIVLNYPSNLEEILVGNNEVVFKIAQGGSVHEVVAHLHAKVFEKQGHELSQSTQTGLHAIIFEYDGTEEAVEIGYE